MQATPAKLNKSEVKITRQSQNKHLKFMKLIQGRVMFIMWTSIDKRHVKHLIFLHLHIIRSLCIPKKSIFLLLCHF